MIAILYPANEASFTSNGLGALKDAKSCIVHEILNGEYELTMEYPVTGQHFEDLKETRLIYVTPNASDDPQPFEIYKIGREIGGMVTVYAQHISYRLSMNPSMPFDATSPSEALYKLGTKVSYPLAFTITSDSSKTGNFSIKVPTSARGVIGELLKKYDLEVKWDGFTVHLTASRGSANGVTINYGKNLTDLKHESDLSGTITGVLPYWTGMDTDTIIGDIVLDTTHDQMYPYHRVVPYDFSNWFGEGVIPTRSELQQAGAEYLANYHTGLAKESLDVTFIPIWQTEEFKDLASVEKISLGDTIRISCRSTNTDVSARVIEYTWDCLKERYENLIVGKARSGLSDQFSKVNEKVDAATETFKTDLQTAIESATDMITGNSGGYIKFNYDADGKPYEMLVMDDDDITQATNVWRFNQAGLGHSSSGYNGPYTTAITQDGRIVADFITTGTLNAGVIKAGLLSDAAGRNYWNMTTGEFSLQSGTQIGGKTISQYMSEVDVELTQQNVFNALTNNGQTQGIYLQNGRLYLNASYIQSGAINASLITTGTLDASRINLSDWIAVYLKQAGTYNQAGDLGGYLGSGILYSYEYDYEDEAWDNLPIGVIGLRSGTPAPSSSLLYPNDSAAVAISSSTGDLFLSGTAIYELADSKRANYGGNVDIDADGSISLSAQDGQMWLYGGPIVLASGTNSGPMRIHADELNLQVNKITWGASWGGQYTGYSGWITMDGTYRYVCNGLVTTRTA